MGREADMLVASMGEAADVDAAADDACEDPTADSESGEKTSETGSGPPNRGAPERCESEGGGGSGKAADMRDALAPCTLR